jgi:septal ring factor EnvC (AmiA/AmiB activator)
MKNEKTGMRKNSLIALAVGAVAVFSFFAGGAATGNRYNDAGELRKTLSESERLRKDLQDAAERTRTLEAELARTVQRIGELEAGSGRLEDGLIETARRHEAASGSIEVFEAATGELGSIVGELKRIIEETDERNRPP